MKNDAVRYLILLVILLLVTATLAVACTPKANTVPVAPKPAVTQPPSTSENQSSTVVEIPLPNPAEDEEQWYLVDVFTGQLTETTRSFHIYGTEWRLTWTLDAEDLEKAIFKLTIYPKEEPFAIWQTVTNSGTDKGTVKYFMSPADKRDFIIKVSALYIRNWVLEVEDNSTAATSYPVEISSIHYQGSVFLPDPNAKCCTYERIEPDEYVVIKNLSDCFQDMTGWKLKNISKPSPTFKFPSFIIYPGDVIRIYTDEFHPETGGLTFYYGFGDIWSNDHSDIAVLYDALGNEVSRKTYLVPMELNPAVNSEASE